MNRLIKVALLSILFLTVKHHSIACDTYKSWKLIWTLQNEYPNLEAFKKDLLQESKTAKKQFDKLVFTKLKNCSKVSFYKFSQFDPVSKKILDTDTAVAYMSYNLSTQRPIKEGTVYSINGYEITSRISDSTQKKETVHLPFETAQAHYYYKDYIVVVDRNSHLTQFFYRGTANDLSFKKDDIKALYEIVKKVKKK